MANPAMDRIVHDTPNFASAGSGAVTLEKVMEKSFATLGLLILTAVVTFGYLGGFSGTLPVDGLQKVGPLAFVAGITTLGLSFWISFSRVIRPWAILLFAALEGVVVGTFSRVAALVAEDTTVVVSAVGGTLVTIAVVFAAYRFFDIQVTDKFRKAITLGMFAFVGVALFDLVLYFFGAEIGVNGFGFTGFIFSLIGLALAVGMLVIDFDAVEQAIAVRAPEQFAWQLAFGLTVTVVWLYINILKILTFFSDN